MPRFARALTGGVVYHVLNRGNDRRQLFHSPAEYDGFVDLIGRACERRPVPVLGYCIMPNHFHLLVWPQHDDDLGQWMQWLMTSHVTGYRKTHKGSGHIWQGRCKTFPSESDGHYFTVLRYVERNALRANLVQRAQHWRWSSASWRVKGRGPAWLADGPLPLPPGWIDHLNEPQTEAELAAVRKSVNFGNPFGSDQWVKELMRRSSL